MKLPGNKILLAILVIFSGYGYISSCTHDNEIMPAPATNTPVITRGTNIHLPTDTKPWKLDKTHSSVLWQTNYVGASGLLTGRFNQFGMHDVTAPKMIQYAVTGQPLPDTDWAFYENEPEKTFFNGYVQVNTSNTGEPGRDGGCNIGGMGTTAIIPGVQNLVDSNVAKIKSTKVEFDPLSADYIVTMDLTWMGKVRPAAVTKSIVGKLKYIKKQTITNGDVFGLQLTFQFNCRDFGITSTSISDKIEVQCNMNFKNY